MHAWLAGGSILAPAREAGALIISVHVFIQYSAVMRMLREFNRERGNEKREIGNEEMETEMEMVVTITS